MGRDRATDFAPKPISRQELQAPMTPGMRRLPPEMRDDLHGRKRDMVAFTDPLGARNLGRIKRYVLAATICVPLLACLFWSFELSTFLWMLPLSALYGLLVALLQPSSLTGGLLLWPFGIAFLVLDGQSPFASGGGLVWFYHFLFIAVGALVGGTEDMKGMD